MEISPKKREFSLVKAQEAVDPIYQKQHAIFMNRDMFNQCRIFKKIDKAVEYSEANGNIPIFACDIEVNAKVGATKAKANQKSKVGNKYFMVTGYQTFWYIYAGTEVKQRHHYEIILNGIPCHLHVDAEFSLLANEGVDTTKMDREFRLLLIKVLMAEKIIQDEDVVEILTLDSSNEKKLSLHYIIRMRDGRQFKDNYHCGAFMRKLRNYAMMHYGELKDNIFFFWREKNNGSVMQKEFMADLSIYTLRRNFRLFGSSKVTSSGELRVLFLKGDTPKITKNEYGEVDIDMIFNKSTFFDFVIQRYEYNGTMSYIECKDIDGSEPRSTSNTKLGRLDLQDIRHLKAVNSLTKRQDANAKSFVHGDKVPSYCRPIAAMISEYITKEFEGRANNTCTVSGFLEDSGILFVKTESNHCVLKKMARPNQNPMHGTEDTPKNHVYYIVDLIDRKFWQKCYSDNVECAKGRSTRYSIPDNYASICDSYDTESKQKFTNPDTIRTLISLFEPFRLSKMAEEETEVDSI
jgi:hypothetical protein